MTVESKEPVKPMGTSGRLYLSDEDGTTTICLILNTCFLNKCVLSLAEYIEYFKPPKNLLGWPYWAENGGVYRLNFSKDVPDGDIMETYVSG